jgi:hypothetical protein
VLKSINSITNHTLSIVTPSRDNINNYFFVFKYEYVHLPYSSLMNYG